jgi:hypothetical protein
MAGRDGPPGRRPGRVAGELSGFPGDPCRSDGRRAVVHALLGHGYAGSIAATARSGARHLRRPLCSRLDAEQATRADLSVRAADTATLDRGGPRRRRHPPAG